jgi:hypothetical protein
MRLVDIALTMHCTHCIALHCTTLHYSTSHITQYRIAPHYVALHSRTLHYITCSGTFNIFTAPHTVELQVPGLSGLLGHYSFDERRFLKGQQSVQQGALADIRSTRRECYTVFKGVGIVLHCIEGVLRWSMRQLRKGRAGRASEI